jgi:diguanylate cyclase (GGDEF)-like protein
MGAAHGCDDDGSTMHGDTGAYLQAEQSRIASTGTGSAARAPSVNTARCAAPVTAVPDRFGWSASVDPLTGLADRSALMQRLDGALASGPLPGSLAVLYLDIDALRLVNQSFGHEAGDALLRTVADLLVDLLGSGALVTRFGGDTFVALLEGASREDAEAAARRVLERFRSPIAVGDIRIAVAWSIGVACNRRSSTPSSLLRDASGAMVEAKCGTDLRLHVSQPGTRARARRRLQLTADLAGVTGRDELDVHYQPIVHAVDGTLHGFEALVRWRHPEHGWIPPAHFIPLAEDSGAIHAVGAFALRKAVETAVAWDHLRTPTSDLVVAVNVSPRQLLHPGFIDLVTDVLGITGLPARRLTLELTERLLVEEPERVGAVLEHLRALGVQLAIDDFGTGYSALSYLDRLPIDVLKLDRSFIATLASPPRSGARRHRPLALAMIDLAASVGLTTVAEGVETPAQLAALRTTGCEYVQGYLFSRPVDRVMADRLAAGPPLPAGGGHPSGTAIAVYPAADGAETTQAVGRTPGGVS